MRPTKALHRGLLASLDGHIRFLATVHGTTVVMTLTELACSNDARVQCALLCGKVVNPRPS